jgi:hypothetical protein
VAERTTLPENPPWLARLIAEVPTAPSVITRTAGLTDSEKSGELEANARDLTTELLWDAMAGLIVSEKIMLARASPKMTLMVA